MLYSFVKQLIVNGDGKFHVVRIGAETQEALDVKRDFYLADDWQDATQEEYDAQLAAVAPKAEEAKPEAAADEAKRAEAAADEAGAGEEKVDAES